MHFPYKALHPVSLCVYDSLASLYRHELVVAVAVNGRANFLVIGLMISEDRFPLNLWPQNSIESRTFHGVGNVRNLIAQVQHRDS